MKVLKKIYKSKFIKLIRHLLLASVLVLFLFVIIVLPYRISLVIGRFLGLVVCYVAASYRKKVDSNLKFAFPEFSEEKIVQIRKAVYMNIGMNLVEFGLVHFRSKRFWEKRITVPNKKLLDDLQSQGKGVILMSGHIGNWELLGSFLAIIGYPINVIAREIYDERLNWLLVKMRALNFVKTIYRDGSANVKKMMRVIKKGEMLGVLIDQDTKVGGVFVDFFGKKAYTPTAVSQFARIKNAVVVPAFIYRKPDLTHELVLMDPVKGGKNIEEETQHYTKIIENFIREHPAQWVWMHARWKRQKD